MNNAGDLTDRDIQPDYTKLRNMLAEIFLQYQPSLDRYQWPMESMRWNELVYCVLESLGTDLSARPVVKVLSELDLLDIDKLAELDVAIGHKATPRGQLVLGILKEAGFDDASARQAILVLAQAAKKVQIELDGNIQRLLRQEGERMIQNVVAFIGFAGLDEKLARHTVTRWLQNVLNVPVCLETESMRTFCAELKTGTKALVAAADDLDINVAIVDDVVQQWYESKVESRRLSQELGDPGSVPAHEPTQVPPQEGV